MKASQSKGKFGAGGIQQLLLLHVEKIVFVLFAGAIVWFLISAIQTETYERQPTELESMASSKRTQIDANRPGAELDKTLAPRDFFRQVSNTRTIDPNEYNTGTLRTSDHLLGRKRGEPDYLPIADLSVSMIRLAVAEIADVPAVPSGDQMAQDDKPKKGGRDNRNDRLGRPPGIPGYPGANYGDAGGTGLSGELGGTIGPGSGRRPGAGPQGAAGGSGLIPPPPGVGGANDPAGAQLGAGAGGAPGTTGVGQIPGYDGGASSPYGGQANVEPRKGVPPPPGSVSKGYRGAVIVGRVPLKKQLQLFAETFRDVKKSDPFRDVPQYVTFHIERADVTSGEQDLKWEGIQTLVVDNLRKMEKWATYAPEVVDSRLTRPLRLRPDGLWDGFTFPLPPILNEDFGDEVTIKDIPRIDPAAWAAANQGAAQQPAAPSSDFFGGAGGKSPERAASAPGQKQGPASSQPPAGGGRVPPGVGLPPGVGQYPPQAGGYGGQPPGTGAGYGKGAGSSPGAGYGTGGVPPAIGRFPGGGQPPGVGASGIGQPPGVGAGGYGGLPPGVGASPGYGAPGVGAPPGVGAGGSSGLIPPPPGVGDDAGGDPYGAGGYGYGNQGYVDANKDFLFRFFDFTVEPGHRYRYRVRLVLQNPNYDLHERYLEKKDLGVGEYRFSPWSDPTDVISITGFSELIAGPVRRVAGSIEPVAKLIVRQRDADTGATVEHEFMNVDRGQLLNVSIDMVKSEKPKPGEVVRTKDPITLTVTELNRNKKFEFKTDELILDLKGGDRLPFKPPVDTSGEMLVLDRNGFIDVRTELSDDDPTKSQFAEASKRIEELAKATLPVETQDAGGDQTFGFGPPPGVGPPGAPGTTPPGVGPPGGAGTTPPGIGPPKGRGGFRPSDS